MIEIKVTQEDIDNGKVIKCTECPVALAMQRVFKDKICSAGPLWLMLVSDNKVLLRQWSTPPAVAKFMESFDRRAKVSPFTFYLQ